MHIQQSGNQTTGEVTETYFIFNHNSKQDLLTLMVVCNLIMRSSDIDTNDAVFQELINQARATIIAMENPH